MYGQLYSHAVCRAQLVLWHDERDEGPQCTGQDRIGQTHQPHDDVREELIGWEKREHGVGTQRQDYTQVHCGGVEGDGECMRVCVVCGQILMCEGVCCVRADIDV